VRRADAMGASIPGARTTGRVTPTSTKKNSQAGEWYLEQTTAVGVYPQGASSEGVLDLVGNVWEWCLNKYERPDQVEADTSGDSRVARGGSWGYNPGYARGSRRFRYQP
jgi:formylglycine-generating enzyme required for sulfatase activity